MSFRDLFYSHPKLVSVSLFGAGFAVASILFRFRFPFRARGLLLPKGASRANSRDSIGDLNNEANQHVSGEYKMVLIVRMDLNMGKGKVAAQLRGRCLSAPLFINYTAQCAHAAVGAVEKLSYENMAALKHWRRHGQPKVVLKVSDEETLLSLAKIAESKNVSTCIISDAGRTQIAAGSKTVLALGPAPASLIDQISGHLKLL